MKTERWCLACLLDDTPGTKRIQVPARQIDVSSQAGMLIIKDEEGNWEHVYCGIPFNLYYYDKEVR